jgi:hypothetical protein
MKIYGARLEACIFGTFSVRNKFLFWVYFGCIFFEPGWVSIIIYLFYSIVLTIINMAIILSRWPTGEWKNWKWIQNRDQRKNSSTVKVSTQPSRLNVYNFFYYFAWIYLNFMGSVAKRGMSLFKYLLDF